MPDMLYNGSSDNIEVDEMLSDLPIELTILNIKEQLSTPQSTINYLENFKDEVDEIDREYSNEDNFDSGEKTLNELRTSVANDVIDIISNEYNVTIDTESYTGEDIFEIAEALYNVFVVDYMENIERYLYKYIKKYKKSLAEDYKNDESLIKSKKIKDKDLFYISNNLPDVIQFLIREDIDETEFIELATEEDSYDRSVLLELMGSGAMFGDFADALLGKLNDEFSYIRDAIILNVQSKLNKKK